MSKYSKNSNLNQQSYLFHYTSNMAVINSFRRKLIIRWNFTVFQLSLGVRHLKKMILGTANNFNLGTKTRYLQYTLTANPANKIEKKEKEKKKIEQ